MALKGRLKEFNISEIFQFLSFSHKTGVLKIVSEETGNIYFKNGEGYYATSTKYNKPLGQRMVEAGLISQEDLQAALESQKKKPNEVRIGRVLLEMKLVDEKALEEFIKEQIWDAFLDILSWEKGEFEFDVGKVPPGEDIGITFEAWNKLVADIPSFENIIKSEQWSKIKEAIPSFDTIFALNEGRAADVVGISLAPSEWGLVCLIDGKRTVNDLMREYGKDSFQAGYTLYKLLRAGLITEVGDRKKTTEGSPKKIETSEEKTDRSKEERFSKKEKEKVPISDEKAKTIQSSKENDKQSSKDTVKVDESASTKVKDVAGASSDTSSAKMQPDKVEEKPRLSDRAGEKSDSNTKEAEKKETTVVSKSEKVSASKDGENKEKGSPDGEVEASTGQIEIKSLGNLEVWVGKEKRFADLFVIKKGDKASNVLRYPDGKYQFVHDRFSSDEKKEILEKIALVKK